MALKMLGGKPVPMPNPYDDLFSTVPAKGNVSVENKKTGKIISDTTHEVHPGIAVAPDKLCTVGVSASHTINIGNFESVRVSASITMPSTKDEIDTTYDFASEWVSSKITDAAKSFKS